MLPVLPSVRCRVLLTGILMLSFLTACSAIRFGGAPSPDLGGTWTGAVEIDGQRLEGSLAVEQEGPRLAAVFTAPAPGLVAEGEGEVTPEGQAWIDFEYDLECPGTARLEGRLDEEANLFSGAVDASDCTGVVSGSFTFRR